MHQQLWGVQSWREIACGGMPAKKVQITFFWTIHLRMAVKLSALRASRPYPQEDSFYLFLLEAEPYLHPVPRLKMQRPIPPLSNTSSSCHPTFTTGLTLHSLYVYLYFSSTDSRKRSASMTKGHGMKDTSSPAPTLGSCVRIPLRHWCLCVCSVCVLYRIWVESTYKKLNINSL
jgi:hypothetical protein